MTTVHCGRFRPEPALRVNDRSTGAASLSFERFINCPYDRTYVHFLRGALFTTVQLGLTPRIASERLISNEHRLDKICELIPRCRFSIHDLSRLQMAPGEPPRMNMPFELGMDWAWNVYARPGNLPPKQILILGKDTQSIRAALSDIQGSDFDAHDNQVRDLVAAIRNFFFDKKRSSKTRFPHVSDLWDDFNVFTGSLQILDTTSRRFRPQEDIDRMPVAEFLALAGRWNRLGHRKSN